MLVNFLEEILLYGINFEDEHNVADDADNTSRNHNATNDLDPVASVDAKHHDTEC